MTLKRNWIKLQHLTMVLTNRIDKWSFPALFIVHGISIVVFICSLLKDCMHVHIVMFCMDYTPIHGHSKTWSRVLVGEKIGEL
jgi:hypothetical protein